MGRTGTGQGGGAIFFEGCKVRVRDFASALTWAGYSMSHAGTWDEIKCPPDGLGNTEQTIIIANSNQYRMNPNFPFHFSAQQLRVSSQMGWMYATPGCGMGVDKADFHAIGAIGGIDGKPELATIKSKKYENKINTSSKFQNFRK